MKKLPVGSKILIANDSIGLTGVKTYVSNISRCLRELGYKVVLIEPTDDDLVSIKTPIDQNFHWTFFATPIIAQKFLENRPDAVLITTVEAPIGKATKDICDFLEVSKVCKSCNYTLSYTTDIGKYFSKSIESSFLGDFSSNFENVKIKEKKIIDFSERQFIKNRYSGAKRIMVNSKSSREKMVEIGMKNVVLSHRGIDKKTFRLPVKGDKNPYLKYDWYRNNKLPVLSYVGRVSYEKDIHFFLQDQLNEFHRVVIGDGPAKKDLYQKFGKKKNVYFLGSVPREEVAKYFMFSDVSFFPSSFDTFGNTIIESSACGTPVIGFNVQGPKDVVKVGLTGFLTEKGESLFKYLDQAKKIDKKECSEYTHRNFSWEKATEELLENLFKIKWSKTLA